MKYLSVCSGIEAATQAWHSLGWEPAAFSEIEKFPSAVLAHHYPWIENLGDMTQFKGWPDYEIDLLVGGTPCQSFSVAGLRAGLDDPRGNLALVFAALCDRYRPRWVVWENVPGVLSADKGRAFGSILGALAELGYGWAYRVLDAQFVRTRRYPGAVPQRRRRVFVVAHLGDWRRAAAVLFDPESLSGNPPPRREAGEKVAPSVTSGPPFSRTGNERVECEAIVPEVAGCLPAAGATEKKHGHGWGQQELTSGYAIPVAFKPGQSEKAGGPFFTEGFSPTLQGQNNGSTAVPAIAFHNRQDPDISDDVTHPLGSMDNGMAVAYGFKRGQGDKAGSLGYDREVCPTLTGVESGTQNPPGIHAGMAVRRLTPVECERLQGFPDNFTRIPWRGKPAEKCPDGPRYKALGNSMAVNCMEWLGQRIQMVDSV